MTRPLLLGLLASVALTGCAGHVRLPDGVAPLLGAGHMNGGVVPVSGDEAYGALFLGGVYLALGAAIAAGFVVGFFVDLFFLPFSGEDDDLFFPCCRSLVKVLKWI